MLQRLPCKAPLALAGQRSFIQNIDMYTCKQLPLSTFLAVTSGMAAAEARDWPQGALQCTMFADSVLNANSVCFIFTLLLK
jgi:hypothetical protein